MLIPIVVVVYYARAGAVGRYFARCAPGDCVIAARPGTSKIENDTFALLNYVLGNGKQHHQVNPWVRPVDMAFMLQHVVLVVEFDGSYWHRERTDKDAEKAAIIEQTGSHLPHRVVRIREAPLKALDLQDVVVPAKGDPLTCASLLLLHVTHTVYEVAQDLDVCRRIESFLTSAATLLAESLLTCRDCGKLRLHLEGRGRDRHTFAWEAYEMGRRPKPDRNHRWNVALHQRARRRKQG